MRQLLCGLLAALLCALLAACNHQSSAPNQTLNLSQTQQTEQTAPPTQLPETTAQEEPDEEYPPLRFTGDASVVGEPDFTAFAGVYKGNGDYMQLTVDDCGNFSLYRTPEGEASVSGRILYICKPEFFAFYAYDGVEETYHRVIRADEEKIEIADFGVFFLTMKPTPIQGDFKDFEGAWYLDGDLYGDVYLLIDLYGNFSSFGTETVDTGVLKHLTDGTVEAVFDDGHKTNIELISETELRFDIEYQLYIKDE